MGGGRDFRSLSYFEQRARLDDIEQLRRDTRHWNGLHPDRPIDLDPDGALAASEAICIRILAELT